MESSARRRVLDYLWTSVCIALWLDQVLHLVQPHQVYDQVYESTLEAVHGMGISILLWQTIPPVDNPLGKEVQTCITATMLHHQFPSMSSGWGIFKPEPFSRPCLTGRSLDTCRSLNVIGIAPIPMSPYFYMAGGRSSCCCHPSVFFSVTVCGFCGPIVVEYWRRFGEFLAIWKSVLLLFKA